ncbi:MAG: hypothetical protein KKF46_03410 [Nanoarchaeota archaeon]|nr:hypothetical protein [Nanoarchaeota archaeon]MBU1321382.1 hypothetical protein [Nanoarchaeota archaeon]MBU1597442.1 hypothetical protein [Nanoarchaeota archaeon]MBU2441352.1 hypothetical protein [Nanoarchaeota archaeon]
MKQVEYIKKAILLMIVLGLLYTGITSVFGVQGATDIDVGVTSRANTSNWSSGQSTTVQAGNVTEINISGQAITDHWAGFYGEISGSITLANSDGNVFYNWTGLNTIAGEVFAANESTIGWGGIACADSGTISSLNTWLGAAATDADTVNATYTRNDHADFSVGGTALSSCNSTNAYTSSGAETTTFYQVLLKDGDGTPVFAAIINETTTGFDGNTHDFELLVGEPEGAGTTMYFYIELD